MLVDYHMHLRAESTADERPDHAVAAIERYVEVAESREVDEIGITEHVYYFRETRQMWSLPYQLVRCTESLDAYCDVVLEAKRRGLPVKLGLEVDWIGDRADELAQLLAPYPWDYLLGSVHWIGGLAVDSRPGIWEHVDPPTVWRLYLGELEAAARSGHFDALAHPDLAKIFGDRVDCDWSGLFTALNGRALEVSTAGLHKPVGEIYPEGRLLRAAAEAGIPITLASDAHEASHVGRDLDRALAHAAAAGYSSVTVFERRKPRLEPLG